MGGETLLLLAFGCGVGAYGTLIGMGGGFILVPALLLYPREQTTTITTISLAVVCCSALSDSAAWTYRTGVAFAATVPGLVAGVFATGLSRRDPLRPAARHPADRPGPLAGGAAQRGRHASHRIPARSNPSHGGRCRRHPLQLRLQRAARPGEQRAGRLPVQPARYRRRDYPRAGDAPAAAHPGAGYPRTGVHRDLPLRALLHRVQRLGGACAARRSPPRSAAH